MNKGKISHVPVLTGATTDESFARSDQMEAEMKFWYPTISKPEAAALSKIYRTADFASQRDAVAAAVGESVLRCGVSVLELATC